MLNIAICKKCQIKGVYSWNLGQTVKPDNKFLKNLEKHSKAWLEGYFKNYKDGDEIYCPFAIYENYIITEPPKNCPYFLEQTISKNIIGYDNNSSKSDKTNS